MSHFRASWNKLSEIDLAAAAQRTTVRFKVAVLVAVLIVIGLIAYIGVAVHASQDERSGSQSGLQGGVGPASSSSGLDVATTSSTDATQSDTSYTYEYDTSSATTTSSITISFPLSTGNAYGTGTTTSTTSATTKARTSTSTSKLATATSVLSRGTSTTMTTILISVSSTLTAKTVTPSSAPTSNTIATGTSSSATATAKTVTSSNAPTSSTIAIGTSSSATAISRSSTTSAASVLSPASSSISASPATTTVAAPVALQSSTSRLISSSTLPGLTTTVSSTASSGNIATSVFSPTLITTISTSSALLASSGQSSVTGSSSTGITTATTALVPSTTTESLSTSISSTGVTVVTPTATVSPLPSFGIPGKLYYSFAVGTNLTLATYESMLGHRPALKHEFFKITSTGFALPNSAKNFVLGVNAAWPRALVMLTLEPWVGLTSLTNTTFQNIAKACVGWNQAGIQIQLRFAHEMNAAWYPWGNIPDTYVETWQTFSTILRATLRNNSIADGMTTMVWCPNVYYSGLPYTYADFYPGDEHVDWVALDIYGPMDVIAPWNNFISKVTTAGGINFYDVYSAQKNKPMMIPETSSSAPLTVDPDYELLQKRSWWSQLYNATLIANYPMLRIICWFEVTKNGRTYGVFANSTILSTFLGDLPSSLMVYSD